MPRVPTSGELPEALLNTAVTVEDIVSSVQDLRLTLGPTLGSTVLTFLATHHAPPIINGATLNDQLNSVRILPTGCKQLDAVLRGGLREGTVTEVSGESATGKTQLALMMSAVTAGRGELVVYIDTSNAFTGARFMKMLGQVPGRTVPMEASLNNVHVVQAYTIHEVLAALDAVLHALMMHNTTTSAAAPAAAAAAPSRESNLPPLPSTTSSSRGTPSQPSPVPKLIIVDSIGAVLAPPLGGAGQHTQGHALLSLTAFTLKAIAHHCRTAVVVTNHMVGGSGSGREGPLRKPGTNTSNTTMNVATTGTGGVGGSSSFVQSDVAALGGGPGGKRPALGESWHNAPHLRIGLYLPEGGGGGNRIARLPPGPQVGEREVVVQYRLEESGVVGVGG